MSKATKILKEVKDKSVGIELDKVVVTNKAVLIHSKRQKAPLAVFLPAEWRKGTARAMGKGDWFESRGDKDE